METVAGTPGEPLKAWPGDNGGWNVDGHLDAQVAIGVAAAGPALRDTAAVHWLVTFADGLRPTWNIHPEPNQHHDPSKIYQVSGHCRGGLPPFATPGQGRAGCRTGQTQGEHQSQRVPLVLQ